MYPLTPAPWLQPPTFDGPDAEDRYYQAYAPRNRRMLPLVPLAAVVGFLALIADLWPR